MAPSIGSIFALEPAASCGAKRFKLSVISGSRRSIAAMAIPIGLGLVANRGHQFSAEASRVVCAIDCGTVINPDTVRAQVEGAVIYGVTAALYGEITLKNGRVEQTNFDTYQALRIDEAPTIEVHIVQSGEAPGGVGEAGT